MTQWLVVPISVITERMVRVISECLDTNWKGEEEGRKAGSAGRRQHQPPGVWAVFILYLER